VTIDDGDVAQVHPAGRLEVNGLVANDLRRDMIDEHLIDAALDADERAIAALTQQVPQRDAPDLAAGAAQEAHTVAAAHARELGEVEHNPLGGDAGDRTVEVQEVRLLLGILAPRAVERQVAHHDALRAVANVDEAPVRAVTVPEHTQARGRPHAVNDQVAHPSDLEARNVGSTEAGGPREVPDAGRDADLPCDELAASGRIDSVLESSAIVATVVRDRAVVHRVGTGLRACLQRRRGAGMHGRQDRQGSHYARVSAGDRLRMLVGWHRILHRAKNSRLQ
jgi:hypothetical protein